MIVGRIQDFLEKMHVAGTAWKREDASLSLMSREFNFTRAVLWVECMRRDRRYERDWEEFDDEFIVDCYHLMKQRNWELRRELIRYFESTSPAAKSAEKNQLTLKF